MSEVEHRTTVGGVYCRVPHITDDEQVAVDIQESQCRTAAAEAGIAVPAEQVFVDRRRSVWRHGPTRPGWSALLTAVKNHEFDRLYVHRIDALLPHRADDAVHIVELCEEHGVEVESLADGWRMRDARQRHHFLDLARDTAAQAEAVSRTSRAAHQRAAATGNPHGGGRRAYGYEAGMTALVPHEADVVRELFARYIGGETMRALTWDLNTREVPTATGAQWTAGGVGRIIVAPRYAGLRVLRGEVLRDERGEYQFGCWEPLVTVADWELACAVRTGRAAATIARPPLFYLLSGILMCDICGRTMVGSVVGDYRMYACSSSSSATKGRCTSHIGADTLEQNVVAAAVAMLGGWDAGRAAGLPVVVRREPPTGRSALIFGAVHRSVAVRSPAALDDVGTGPAAASGWARLTGPRQAEVLRFLFAEVRIGPKTTQRGVFDDSRIRMVPNEL